MKLRVALKEACVVKMTNKKILLFGLSVFMLLLVINIVSAYTYEAIYEETQIEEIVKDNETILLNVTISVYTYNTTNIKHPLKKGLIFYYPDPNQSILSLSELKDLLRLYLQIPINKTKINVSGEGNFSNVSFKSIIDKAENIAIEIPKCVDETEFGECSITTPRYCYVGSLVERCDLCGCPSMQECQRVTGKCVTPLEKTCSDGTTYNKCSTRKPLYCDNGMLYDRCDLCGCSNGRTCNETTNSCSGCPTTTSLGDIDRDGIEDTLTKTCLKEFGNISNNIIAFTTYEGSLGEDLNRDGDTSDYVLRYYDINTDKLVNTGIVTSWARPVISNNTIAFVTYEDHLLRYYNINTNEVINTGIVMGWYSPSISNNIIAFVTHEDWVGDLNGDGDVSDRVLRYYDINRGKVVNTGVDIGQDIANNPAISNNIVAFTTNEGGIGEDLNGDGDISDWILRYYDINRGKVVNTGINMSWDDATAISNNIIVLRSNWILGYITLSKYREKVEVNDIKCEFDGCSERKPHYCDNGILIDNCQKCGCPEGKECQANGFCIAPTCADRTLYSKCSSTKPLYCDKGVLVDKCNVCGCPADYTCQSDGSCKNILETEKTLSFSSAGNQTVYLKIPKDTTVKSIKINLTSWVTFSSLDVGNDGDYEWSLYIYDVHREEWVGSCPTKSWACQSCVPGLAMAGKLNGKTIDKFDILIKPNRPIELSELRLYILYPYSQININGTWSGSICKVATENVSSPCSSDPIFLFDNFGLYGLPQGWATISTESKTILAKGPWKIMFDTSYPNPNNLPYNNGLGIQICGYSSKGNIFFANISGDEYYEGGSPYLHIISFFNKTNFAQNLANEVNDYLATCTADAVGNCLVPMVFHSGSDGTIRISNVSVISQTCSDGTSYGSCSKTKPLYCDNGNLVNNCQLCGCDSSYACQEDGSCIIPIKPILNISFECDAKDYSRYGNNGIIYEATFVAGKVGNALSFDGVNDKVYVGNLGIGANGIATIEAWFNFNQFAQGSTYKGLHSILYQHPANNHLYITGTNDFFNVASDLQLNTWHHIVLTYSGDTSTAKLYINNKKYNIVIQAGAETIPALTNFVIGDDGHNEFFNGTIDEVKIYNQTLSAEQIKTHYQSELNETGTLTCECSDGTLYSKCSATKPLYCDNGNLVDKCNVCGCPEGTNCKKDDTCAGNPDIVVSGASFTNIWHFVKWLLLL